MKTLLLLLALLPAHASDFRIFSNGMTCFQDNTGFTYGCSGGSVNRGDTYMDLDSGQLIHQINRNNALNLDTGQILFTPNLPYRDEEYQGEE